MPFVTLSAILLLNAHRRAAIPTRNLRRSRFWYRLEIHHTENPRYCPDESRHPVVGLAYRSTIPGEIRRCTSPLTAARGHLFPKLGPLLPILSNRALLPPSGVAENKCFGRSLKENVRGIARNFAESSGLLVNLRKSGSLWGVSLYLPLGR